MWLGRCTKTCLESVHTTVYQLGCKFKFFYNGLGATTQTMIDVVAGGALMNKTHDEAYELLEEMASNNYQWPSDRSMPNRAIGVHEIDVIMALTAQVASLSKQLGSLSVNVV